MERKIEDEGERGRVCEVKRKIEKGKREEGLG